MALPKPNLQVSIGGRLSPSSAEAVPHCIEGTLGGNNGYPDVTTGRLSPQHTGITGLSSPLLRDTHSAFVAGGPGGVGGSSGTPPPAYDRLTGHHPKENMPRRALSGNQGHTVLGGGWSGDRTQSMGLGRLEGDPWVEIPDPTPAVRHAKHDTAPSIHLGTEDKGSRHVERDPSGATNTTRLSANANTTGSVDALCEVTTQLSITPPSSGGVGGESPTFLEVEAAESLAEATAWALHTDPATKKRFWHNAGTGESRWEEQF